jgi:cell division protein FtsN
MNKFIGDNLQMIDFLGQFVYLVKKNFEIDKIYDLDEFCFAKRKISEDGETEILQFFDEKLSLIEEITLEDKVSEQQVVNEFLSMSEDSDMEKDYIEISPIMRDFFDNILALNHPDYQRRRGSRLSRILLEEDKKGSVYTERPEIPFFEDSEDGYQKVQPLSNAFNSEDEISLKPPFSEDHDLFSEIGIHPEQEEEEPVTKDLSILDEPELVLTHSQIVDQNEEYDDEESYSVFDVGMKVAPSSDEIPSEPVSDEVLSNFIESLVVENVNETLTEESKVDLPVDEDGEQEAQRIDSDEVLETPIETEVISEEVETLETTIETEAISEAVIEKIEEEFEPTETIIESPTKTVDTPTRKQRISIFDDIEESVTIVEVHQEVVPISEEEIFDENEIVPEETTVESVEETPEVIENIEEETVEETPEVIENIEEETLEETPKVRENIVEEAPKVKENIVEETPEVRENIVEESADNSILFDETFFDGVLDEDNTSASKVDETDGNRGEPLIETETSIEVSVPLFPKLNEHGEAVVENDQINDSSPKNTVVNSVEDPSNESAPEYYEEDYSATFPEEKIETKEELSTLSDPQEKESKNKNPQMSILIKMIVVLIVLIGLYFLLDATGYLRGKNAVKSDINLALGAFVISDSGSLADKRQYPFNRDTQEDGNYNSTFLKDGQYYEVEENGTLNPIVYDTSKAKFYKVSAPPIDSVAEKADAEAKNSKDKKVDKEKKSEKDKNKKKTEQEKSDNGNITLQNSVKNKVKETKVADFVYKSGKKYFVQISAHRAFATAEKLAKELKKKGYRAFIMKVKKDGISGEEGIWYRVRIGPYDKEDKAIEVNKELNQKKKK